MTFIDKLITLKPREEAGSKTSRKYRFQKDLSLFLLLENHSSLSDYVFLFDFHEDLVIFDSSTSPSKANFYQIKSKDGSGNWTIKGLTSSEKDKLSILGKLYLNKISFPDNVESLNFISNSKFSFKELKDKSDSKIVALIKGKNLHDDDISECNKKLIDEHKLPKDTDFENYTNFHSTILSNSDSSTHCIGKLNTLINTINPANKINPELAYKQVINEISIKTENTISTSPVENITELITLKGITKKMFLKYLEEAGLYKSIEEEWVEIKQSLETCGIGYKELMKYKASWREMSATLINESNSIPLQKLVDDIAVLIQEDSINSVAVEKMNLLEIVNHTYSKLQKSVYDEYLVKCLVIKQLNEE
ncbi:MAG: DUF4297 domain-containing protein [Bacteroidetes bacterium]|nr:DUF4297 domain-containing protein [Bacteroidota bacterium]